MSCVQSLLLASSAGKAWLGSDRLAQILAQGLAWLLYCSMQSFDFGKLAGWVIGRSGRMAAKDTT